MGQLQGSQKKKHTHTHAKHLRRNVRYKSYVKDLHEPTPPAEKYQRPADFKTRWEQNVLATVVC